MAVTVPSVSRIANGYIIVVLLAVIFRYCLLDARDPFKCGALLNQGYWLDPPLDRADLDLPPSQRPYQLWQPQGCMMHAYSKPEISKCLTNKRVLVVGDASQRQLFWAIAKRLDHRKGEDLQLNGNKTTDLSLTVDNIELEFVWDPFLNTSRVKEELELYKQSNLPAGRKQASGKESAAIIVLGTGHWYARHIGMNMVKKFKETIDDIILYMISDPSPAATIDQRGSSPNLLLLTPVQVPWYDKLSPGREASMTREKIDAMNDYLQYLSAFQGVDVAWSFSQMSWQQSLAYEESGLHVVENVAARRADVLLNLRCNAESARGVNGQGYPYDRTCCSNYRLPNWSQLFFLSAGIFAVPMMLWLKSRDHPRTKGVPSMKVLWSIQALLLVTIFSFYADRTQMFNKVLRIFRLRDLFFISAVTLISGFVWIKKISGRTPSRQVLPQEQMDEWRGWMLGLVLAYYYTSGSTVLWVYRLGRLLIGCYIFITGYGHTMYLLKTADYSFERVAGVLLRMNMLSILLAYVMRTEYLFYYFAPLVSFWYLIVYGTLRIRHQNNNSFFFVFFKALVALGIVALVSQRKGILEFVFRVLKFTSKTDWDAPEWRLRIYLDMLSAFVGMLCAHIVHSVLGAEHRVGDDDPLAVVTRTQQRVRSFLVALAVLISFAYFYGVASIDYKSEYNQWHPLASIAPIVSFALLRNVTPVLRSRYSASFSWLGRLSTEAITLQYHIWLAGDTTGLLSFGLVDQMSWHTNLFLVTPIFLFVSWTAMNATNEIVDWILQGRGGDLSFPGTDTYQSDKDSIDSAVGDLSTEQEDEFGEAGMSTFDVRHEESSLAYSVRGSAPLDWRRAPLSSIGSLWNRSLGNRLLMMFAVLWLMNITT